MFVKSLTVAAIAGAVLFSASPALADDPGLYGAGDPTYDGVYRQSLSILALEATGRAVPKRALKWLKRQQCDDGGFTAYRADTTSACPAPDPVNYAGQDSNSTALAIAALWHTGAKKQARKAASWLSAHVNPDGGWAYYPAPGATSETNSTAVALAALRLTGKKPSGKYLRSAQVPCPAPGVVPGGLRYDSSSPDVNDNATAQAAWVLGGGLRLPAARPLARKAPRSVCKDLGVRATPKRVAGAARGYLADRLASVGGALPYGGGYPGTDHVGSAQAALALAQAGAGRKVVKTTVKSLQKDAQTWITANGDDSPGAIAMLILVADATGQNPKNFADMNLMARLAKTRQ